MTLQEIVGLLGGFSVIVAAIAWLVRSLIAQVLSRDIERYKSQLEHDTEQFKTEIARETKEHETRFTALHQKQRAAVEKLYELVADAVNGYQPIGFLASVDPTMMAKTVDMACTNFSRLQKEFARSRIYFSRSFVDEAEPIIDDLLHIVSVLSSDLLQKRDVATVKKSVLRVMDSVTDGEALLNLVEKHYRDILAVEIEIHGNASQ